MSVKKILIGTFVVIMVMATAGLTGAVIGDSSSAAPTVAAAASETRATPLVVFPDNESLVRDAILSVCGGRPLVNPVSASERADVDQMLTDRARHAAALAGTPLSGSGT